MGSHASTELRALRRLSVSPRFVMLAAAGVAGIALRVWIYRSVLGTPSSDEAVMGLMARHMIHGQFTAFIWSQAYGGPQESLLAVPGFVIAGSSWLALRLVSLGLFLVGLLLVWRIGQRTIGATGAAAAVALYCVWPPDVIFELTHEVSFYGLDVVYCGLLLLLALRIVERPDRLRALVFGLVLGLAFWETAQIVPIAVAVVAWTVWKQPACLRQTWVAVSAAAIGALPWLAWNIGHGWASLSVRSGESVPYDHRLRLFFSPVLPMMLGLRTPGTQAALVPPALLYLIYGSLLVLFLYGAYALRGRSSSLLYVVAAVFPFVYSIAAQTFASSGPRYLVVLTPVLVLLLAQLATNWYRAAAVVALGCAVSVLTLHRMESSPAAFPIAPRNMAPLIATLDRQRLDRVYADFWIAYLLDFDTRERIVVVENRFDAVTFVRGRAVLPSDPVVRYPPYERTVAASRHGFVFFRQGIDSVPIVPQLERHGYRRLVVGPFVVFAPASSRG